MLYFTELLNSQAVNVHIYNCSIRYVMVAVLYTHVVYTMGESVHMLSSSIRPQAAVPGCEIRATAAQAGLISGRPLTPSDF